jgi:hypothetical protein
MDVEGLFQRPLRARRSREETHRLRHADLGSNFGNQIRLNAALANTNNQSTFSRPRSFTLRIHATVFNQPNAARALVTRLEEEPHVNPNTQTREFSLRDPDGYYVTISALALS